MVSITGVDTVPMDWRGPPAVGTALAITFGPEQSSYQSAFELEAPGPPCRLQSCVPVSAFQAKRVPFSVAATNMLQVVLLLQLVVLAGLFTEMPGTYSGWA